MSERAGSLPLIGGALCLDFCNTASGFGTGQEVEHLSTLDDVGAWAVHAGILPEGEARRVVRSTAQEARPAALAEVLQTRSALRDVFVRLARDARPTAASLTLLNSKLSRAFGGAAVSPSGDGFALEFKPSEPSVASIVNAILRSAAGILVSKDAVRLKVCPGRDCGWLFYDGTKNANRVWCEMRVCGSRAKARTYQRRIAEAVAPTNGPHRPGRVRPPVASSPG